MIRIRENMLAFLCNQERQKNQGHCIRFYLVFFLFGRKYLQSFIKNDLILFKKMNN